MQQKNNFEQDIESQARNSSEALHAAHTQNWAHVLIMLLAMVLPLGLLIGLRWLGFSSIFINAAALVIPSLLIIWIVLKST